jgi:coenzyme Q-binding protein COQ10
MPSHFETYHSPYSPQQLFEIVGDVKQYPAFLPWVSGCRIKGGGQEVFLAELLIGFKAFRGGYTSRVSLFPPNAEGEARVDAELVKGPFQSLVNNWRFERLDDGSTMIHFHLEFEFKSRALGKMLNVVFVHAAEKMVQGFEDRAEFLYGDDHP